MNPVALAFFFLGLVLLLAGAGFLVRGASRLASAFGISPLVVGLTVVAWGTGSPELAVGVQAAIAGQPDLAVGNVVGSNIANVLLILGLAAIIAPLKVSQRLVRLYVPLMIGVSFLLLSVSLDGRLGWVDGSLFISALVVYTVWAIRESRAARARVEAECASELGTDEPEGKRRLVLDGLLVPVGLVMLTTGSDWLVDGASAIATALGFSQLIIGLTIVAVGTSLPEIATSAVAAYRGEREIAVGNAVGSNMFNILGVLGVTAFVATDGIHVSPAAVGFDIPIMIGVAIACLPIFFAGNQIDRWEGALFLGLYAGYITYLVLQATQHASLQGFSSIMLVFVLPLILVTLLIILVRGLRSTAE